MLIYMQGNKLIIHTSKIIRDGRITLRNPHGRIVKEARMHDVDFLAVPCDIDTGRYVARFWDGSSAYQKIITIPQRNKPKKNESNENMLPFLDHTSDPGVDK